MEKGSWAGILFSWLTFCRTWAVLSCCLCWTEKSLTVTSGHIQKQLVTSLRTPSHFLMNLVPSAVHTPSSNGFVHRCIIATIIPGVIIFAGGLRLHALLEHKHTSLYFLMMDKLTLVTVLFPKGTELRAVLTTLDFRIEKASFHFLFSHDWEQTAGYTANHPVFLGGASSRSGWCHS